MHNIVLATSNAGKLREFRAALTGLELEIMPQSEWNVPEAEETGLTFVENALIKARNAANHTGLPALADDSGLVVDALGGAPGVYSARYASPNASDRGNLDKLLDALGETPAEQRGAYFQCVLVLLRHAADPTPLICQARWEGLITFEPYGTGGFGYDPVFLVPSEGQTAAELDLAVKNRLSHRGQALAQLVDILKRQPEFWMLAAARAVLPEEQPAS
ncbi:MAG TPA: RdgB/HAM1 family non-canonical purine NTP pyrophosphatase [Candidatus Competibacteraceae bacterium]|nr:RdgB/HAM1 family non-canonical purine NTP pyrophosphatase [Candidatus Competibacteraceae bacterium]MCP5132563.1 RdgB/HAM1 family non-canonical purine NTP pyrophosphatase [Gammaproteobacteria bacterium]HPF59619.1 RdgB/HAM1 family non-canonical purine NTP pyrophosphatase [Candidatus Competibacteraceae bacterium]HRY19299.1 RdgB/HAM1 family non-canonical purine NTP pyrophosphatase [Candidatus Competibacteraceae bacterium]